MARPQKSTVDYFPHYTNAGKTLFVLENDFGNDGYAFWFKLLETLGTTDKMAFDYNDAANARFLQAKTRVNEGLCMQILDTLSLLGAIDAELWENDRIIWVQNLVNNVQDAFKRRASSMPQKPISSVSVYKNPSENEFPYAETTDNNEIDDFMSTETGKGKERKLNERKGKGNITNDSSPSDNELIKEIIKYLNEKTGKKFSHNTESTKKFISGRLSEGRTIENFKYVIDIKTEEWLNDDKMNQYLAPDTLFRPGNFEKYLNQERKKSHDRAEEFKQFNNNDNDRWGGEDGEGYTVNLDGLI